MEDYSKAQERVEKWIRSISKGEKVDEAEAAASKGLTLLKLHKGFVLCDFRVHEGVSDESGKWHEGAMTTLMDIVSSLTATSFTSHDHVTVYLSVSFYSKPNLQEVVEIEGKALERKGSMTSVRVEVRNKDDGQLVASSIMWMSYFHSNNNRTLIPSNL